AAGSAAITVGGDLVVESDATINVQAGEQVTLTGTLGGNAGARLRKAGDGALVYDIDASESVTFNGTTVVEDGELTLNTPGRNVTLGSLVIAPVSASDPATVRLLGQVASGSQVPLSGSHQIANNVTVFLHPGGVLDLNDNNETVGGLNMTGGVADSGTG